MADIVQLAPSLDITTASRAPQITGLLLGENCNAGDGLYIKAADGLLYRTNATAADEKANLAGFAARAGVAGQPMTVFSLGARFGLYAAAGTFTGGQLLYLSAVTPGGLATTPGTGHPTPVARAINDQGIQIIAAV